MINLNTKTKGFTLVEMLVVIGAFSVLAIIASTMVINSMRATKKSESAVKLRDELENAVSMIEKSLRGAKFGSVSCTPSNLSFKDQDDIDISVNCTNTVPRKLVMQSSDLIGTNINLTTCNFDCSYLTSSGVVTINLAATNLDSSGVESDVATFSSRIVLRNY